MRSVFCLLFVFALSGCISDGLFPETPGGLYRLGGSGQDPNTMQVSCWYMNDSGHTIEIDVSHSDDCPRTMYR